MNDHSSTKRRWVAVASFALFSMFFGAGNLIFPPSLGRNMGDQLLPAFFGFSISAVGLVLLSAIATIRAGGTIESVARHLGGPLSMAFGGLILICIGPGLAIPRTAATSHEMLAGAFLPGLSPLITSVFFFAVTLFFVIKPSRVVSGLGLVLTPVLVAILVLLIGKSFLFPLGPMTNTGATEVFSQSFLEGYQTMDALAALAFSIVIIKDFQRRGMKDPKQVVRCTAFASIFAALGLVLVYGGLMYIGATTSSLGVEDLGRVDLLLFSVDKLSGNTGKMLMTIAMYLACLTTAIGLTSTFSDFMERLTKGKIKARIWSILCVTASAILAVQGVDQIVAISAPILVAVYPISIALIVLNLVQGPLNRRSIHIGAVLGATLPALDFLIGLVRGTPILSGEFGLIPEAWQNYYWVVPSIVLALVFYLVLPEKTEKITALDERKNQE